MTLRSCVLRPVAESAAGSDFPGSFQRQSIGREPSRRWAAPVPCAGVQPRLRSLYHYTMCRRITEPVARTVGVSSEPFWLLERHRPAGGTAAPAGVPPGRVFRHPRRAVSESLERAEGTLSEDSTKGSLPSVRVLWHRRRVGLSAWPMLTSPLKPAPSSASAACGLFSRLAPRLPATAAVGASGRQLPG